jgi:hypothetical protein
MKKTGVFLFSVLLICSLAAKELPRPDYDNSLVFSFTYSLAKAPPSELEYLKQQFGKGIYAPLTFSSFNGVNMDWHRDPAGAGSGIRSFKNNVDALINKARANGVGIHLVLNFGMCRFVNSYKAAKQEDIRNAQWFNDNNIASSWQLSQARQMVNPEDEGFFLPLVSSQEWPWEMAEPYAGSTNVNIYVFTTMSRYARKLRSHLEAKAHAALAYLKRKQEEYPDLLMIVSAPGEAELNALRQNNKMHLQEFFCDFSPFAVLEFRDWIRHEGMYGTGGKYWRDGYSGGGSRYRGSSGLNNFNADFGTAFTGWDLKYYHWNLSDPVDSDYTDSVNPDSKIIPLSQYTYDSMLPASGKNFIAGGFDPPRVMRQKGEDAFWDLWSLFRETMVYHYVRDIAAIARSVGFDKQRYFTHQIPADYLFGTRPDDPQIPLLNSRYYSSASPLWTADVFPDIGLGVTMYDINFNTWYARTSQYILPVISALSDNWGALEYNPEILPDGYSMNSVEAISKQILRLYDENVHVISFYQWIGRSDAQFKGTNREKAAKLFFDTVKDKARHATGTVFTPKAVEGFKGAYSSSSASVRLSWSRKIWSDLDFLWSDWGDFKEFVLYRGKTENFIADGASRIARVNDYSYNDSGFQGSGTVYYKLAAVNRKGVEGSFEAIAVPYGGNAGTPILSISKRRITFGAVNGGAKTPVQSVSIVNSGSGVLDWSVSRSTAWIGSNLDSGIGPAVLELSVDAAGKSAGTYKGTVTISDPDAKESPQIIEVTLNVYEAGQDSVPFGHFATPLQGSTVRNSIAVTGWVLDDIAVESVKLYLQAGSRLDYIGAAVFVEGSRPDVETAYPAYPNNYKAGWGYMLLTYFLPNGGNGTFTLHAVATDVSGHQVTLGTRTITCDNAHAVDPFGAIDTPAQGGLASGKGFVNFGWALTPQPNSIASDGSTIDVYVDGVKVGHPVYNNYREDIAMLFPGYANSNGAVGYFYLDTTAYTDGVHTIAWSAMDSAGNSDGIGSRYFTIRNNASKTSARSLAYTVPGAHNGPGRPAADLSRLPMDRRSPVHVKTGYSRNARPKTLYPDLRSGVVNIEIHAMERLEIHLLQEVLDWSPGRVGSTLDRQRAIFYWLPGPAFYGTYRFDFMVRRKDGRIMRKRINVNIVPRGILSNE